MSFKWKDSYSVNIKEIDSQHQRLFQIGAHIYELAELKDGHDHYDEITEILTELRDYTVYHFDFEEKLLAGYGYERTDNQHIEHGFFVKKLERFMKRDIDAGQEEAVTDMLRFTSDWISSHILIEDMKYRDYLNLKGIY